MRYLYPMMMTDMTLHSMTHAVNNGNLNEIMTVARNREQEVTRTITSIEDRARAAASGRGGSSLGGFGGGFSAGGGGGSW
jgi:uncharacterized membrane protein